MIDVFKKILSVNFLLKFPTTCRSVFMLFVVALAACQSQPPGDQALAKAVELRKANPDKYGDVILNILVLSDGSVGDIKIEKSSGIPEFDEFAVNFYRKAKYFPEKKDGKSVDAWKMISVTPRMK